MLGVIIFRIIKCYLFKVITFISSQYRGFIRCSYIISTAVATVQKCSPFTRVYLDLSVVFCFRSLIGMLCFKVVHSALIRKDQKVYLKKNT